MAHGGHQPRPETSQMDHTEFSEQRDSVEQQMHKKWQNNVVELQGKKDHKRYDRIEESQAILQSLKFESLEEAEQALISLKEQMGQCLEEIKKQTFVSRLLKGDNGAHDRYLALEKQFNNLNRKLSPVREVLGAGQVPAYGEKIIEESAGRWQKAA